MPCNDIIAFKMIIPKNDNFVHTLFAKIFDNTP